MVKLKQNQIGKIWWNQVKSIGPTCMFAGHNFIPIFHFTLGFCINFTKFSVNMVKLAQKPMKVGKETTALESWHISGKLGRVAASCKKLCVDFRCEIPDLCETSAKLESATVLGKVLAWELWWFWSPSVRSLGNDSPGFPFRPIFVDAQVKVHEILRSLTFTRALLTNHE